MKRDTQIRDDDVDCWQVWNLDRVGGLVVSDRRMSNVATAVGAEDDTLKRPINPDDSLCTDEFEIISSDPFDNGADGHVDDTISQWTIQHNINVESLVPLNNLASLLCSTHSDGQSVTPK
ncbi:hypothetical protein Y032_0531g3030 [Ancylostoma ceylanicum]|uniref:Uncharacterized protein n=2 Tax=Ancylostoma ceylanicum TaxID=53326 RepID=A0A016WS83_9BILA|nr:hypothetical protein Y032_0531g3030 [Ancylostoma ceylanicum]